MNKEQFQAFVDWMMSLEHSVARPMPNGDILRFCPSCGYGEYSAHNYDCKLNTLLQELAKQ